MEETHSDADAGAPQLAEATENLNGDSRAPAATTEGAADSNNESLVAATEGELPATAADGATDGLVNPSDEHEMLRRAMVNTMRLFSADQLGADAEVFRQTVLQTLEIVREQRQALEARQGATGTLPVYQERILPEGEPSAEGFVFTKEVAEPLEPLKPSPMKIDVASLKQATAPVKCQPVSPHTEDSTATLDMYSEDRDHGVELALHERSQTPLGGFFMPVIASPVFNWVVLAAIGCNCVQLAAHDPLDEKADWLQTADVVLEWILFAVFTAEMVLKNFALGCRLYWSDRWNILDGTIVVVGYLQFIPEVGNMGAIRVLRILKPVRIVGKLRGMRVIIKTLRDALLPLLDTVLLCLLIFSVFGIVGMYLFKGTLHQRCYTPATACVPGNSTACVEASTSTRLCGSHSCSAGQVCIVGSDSLNYGLTNFDNIFTTFLTIFVALTLEGWVDVMYALQDSYGYWGATIYFHLLIIIGSLFVLNLALAVIADSYGNMIENEVALIVEEDDLNSEHEESSDEDADVQISRVDGPESEETPETPIIEHIARSRIFAQIIMLFIVANTICLACENVGEGQVDGVNQAIEMSDSAKDVLKSMNFVFIAVFTAELLIKFIGLGPREYIADRFNIFDALVVLLSYVELFFEGNTSLSALRTLRLARILKLTKSWDSLRELLNIIWDTLPAVGYLSVVMLLFMFIMSVAGMQFFGGKMRPPYLPSKPRSNFDNFPIAMLTVFTMLSGENWNEVMYNSVEATNNAAIAFFLVLIVFGNYMLLNLFIAILLSNFSGMKPPDFSWHAFKSSIRNMCYPNAKVTPIEPRGDPTQKDLTTDFSIVNAAAILQASSGYSKQSKQQTLVGTSLLIFRPNNPIRTFAWDIVEHPYFDCFILCCIVVSSITLAIEYPDLDDDGTLKKTLEAFDLVFTIIFSIEMVLKIVVYGFVCGKGTYLQDPWNVIDFMVVMSSLLFVSGVNQVGFFKVLRIFRCMRPLRMIKRAPGLKCVVDAIMGCMPAFIQISCVTACVYLVFAIMGVQLWAGKFWYCNDDSVSVVTQCRGNFINSDGEVVIRRWANQPMNFDNVWNGMLTLFEVASLELWLDVLHSAMDVPENIGEQPKENRCGFYALYFVVFVVIGCYLLLNLFVGAVVDNFNEVKQATTRSAVITEDQQRFVQTLKSMMRAVPEGKTAKPKGDKDTWLFRLRLFMFRVSTFNWKTWKQVQLREMPTFDSVTSALIICNIVVMSAIHWTMPPFPTLEGSDAAYDAQNTTWNQTMEWINFGFTVIFCVEAAIKLMGLGVAQYFQNRMNAFDFFIVCISILGMLCDFVFTAMSDDARNVIIVLRAGRVIRIFRLAGRIKGIRRLLLTLLYAFPALLNVSILLFLVLFIFSVLAMNFFGSMQLGVGHYGLLNEHANFKNFYYSFFTLFRMATGESWNGIMHDIMEVYPHAWLFFVSYMVVCAYLMFNLVIAVLLDEFSSAAAQESDIITPEMVENYAFAWQDLDPTASHFIPCDTLPMLLKRVEPPLGVGADADVTAVIRLLKELRIKQFGGSAHFVETFIALVSRAYRVQELDSRIYNEVVEQLIETFPSIKDVDQKEDQHGLIQTIAATRMQALMRGHHVRKNMRDVKQHKEARRRLAGGGLDLSNAISQTTGTGQ